MAKNVSLVVRGKQHEWAVDCVMKQNQIDAMREDGLDIDEPLYRIPLWVAELGFARPWCFCQDVFNFRNPFAN